MDKTFKQKLKKLFRGYRTMTPKLEAQLKKLGFCIIRRKRHVILSYEKDGVKPVHITVSSTSSDRRAGLNMASTIVLLLASS